MQALPDSIEGMQAREGTVSGKALSSFDTTFLSLPWAADLTHRTLQCHVLQSIPEQAW